MSLFDMSLKSLRQQLETLKKPDEEEIKAELIQQIEEAKIYKSLKKLNQLTGSEGMDAFGVIALEADKIINDEDIYAALTTQPTKNESKTILGVRMATKIVPVLTSKYRTNVLNILSILTGKPAAELSESSLRLIIKLVQRVLTEDKDIINFFMSLES